MKPVMTALQTIATLQSGARDGPVEAASMWPTEPVLSQRSSASSRASCDGRNGRTAACAKATADFNRTSGAIAHVDTKPKAAFAWDRDIRIDKRDRVVVAPARGVTVHSVTIITAVLFLGLALCLGWIGGLNSEFFVSKLESPSVEKVTSSTAPPDAAKSERLTVQGSSSNTRPTSNVHETSKRGAQITDSLLTKQAARAPLPPAVERAKVSTKSAPGPETRPTTIEGWTIREVNGSTAVLEGPNGTWKATLGDTVPGVGKIDSIVRWGNRWIVATSRGLISTR
jgi:hypothetical protein